ncbi:MAG: aspartyl protease family protein [Candidatus Aminicenantes bacterium]|nr:aspartyl protease family protein [Candidatus Aminicenantes bacterium]
MLGHRFRKRIILVKIVIVVIVLAGVSGCTMIKMGSLFLAGRLDQKGYYSEVDILYRRGLILVPVQINNSPETYHFLFDTSATFSVISPALALSLAVAPKVSDTIVDSNQKKGTTDFVTLNRITIGGIPFDGTGAGIFDLNRIPSLPSLGCYAADGVIGMNLMRLAPYWHLDYARRKLILTDQEDRLPHLSPVLILPFKQTIQRIPEIALEWNGLRLPFKVDLGSTSGFRAPLEYWQEIRGRRKDTPSVAVYGELLGGAMGVKASRGRTAVLQTVKSGDYRAPALLLAFYPEALASVGNDFFGRFAVTFDWGKNEIRLTPQVPESPPLLETFGFGFSFNAEERKLYVSYLYEGSPAEKAGVQIGDRILRINDLKFDSVTVDDYCRFYLDPDLLFGPGKTLSLQVEGGGKQKTCTLSKTVILQ